jgi:prolyl-tRNA synthetase
VGLTLPLVIDHSVTAMSDAITGALAKDLHYKHIAYGRDFEAWMIEDIRTVKAADRCSLCGGELYIKMGNELGHIFKLGNKYTSSMNVSFLDESGKAIIPTMGCYGIGVDRTLASVIEEHHDDAGIIWPISVAPYHVIIVPIKYDGAVKNAADQLVIDLEQAGIEVLLDDRNERPGVKFNDADLIGIPWRVVIGEKGLMNAQVELKRRNEKESRLLDINSVSAALVKIIKDELEMNSKERLTNKN